MKVRIKQKDRTKPNQKVQFLKNLYDIQCQEGDYVILSVKGKNIKWKDVPIRYSEKTINKDLRKFFTNYPSRDYDLYFATVPFKSPHRRISEVIESKFLFADLDEKTPRELKQIKNSDLPPRYLWESSPGKYQCLVEIDRYMDPQIMEQLNKGLEQYYGADNCGDVVHVIRVPGTINHKYKNNPSVKPAKVLGKPIRLKDATKTLKPKKEKKEKPKKNDSSQELLERQLYAKYNIPKRVRDLLAASVVEDRSSAIWYIENKLSEIGMKPNEIIYLVKNSIFNKYKGRKDEDKRLRRELDKIIEGKIDKSIDANTEPLKIDSYQDLMSDQNNFPGWLIEGFWGRRSHGIVAGQPKVFKSTFVQDLIVSVASGEPFLGKYPVLEPGPVILVQNENAEWLLKDKTEKLIKHRGLVGKVKRKGEGKYRIKFPPELPIHFMNQQGFSFSNPSHLEQIEAMIKKIKPVLVVFDPLYLMFDGDLNKASDIGPVLQWLLHIKKVYNTGIILIHHYNKGGSVGQVRSGQKMLGSAILHGWVESAWYLTRPDEDLEEPNNLDPDKLDQQSDMPTKVILDREFRLAGAFSKIQLEIKMGGYGDPYYNVDVSIAEEKKHEASESPGAVKRQILNFLKNYNAPQTKAELSENLGIKRQFLNVAINELLEQGKIIPQKNGYVLTKGKT